MDKRSVWSDYIMPGQMDGLTSLLDEIPTDARIQRLSAMPLLLDRRPDRQLCLYGYDEVGQQEKADAEDRLSILGE